MIRTGEQYLAGLRDGRTVYYDGERVEDVTKHHSIGLVAHEAAEAMDFKGDPELRKKLVRTVGGQESRIFYHLPTTQVELAEYVEGLNTGIGHIQTNGVAVMQALAVVGRRMDEKLGTSYASRALAFLARLRDEDLTCAATVSDVKGDRSKSASQQLDPDLFVHIVERRSDGIVIRGAKASITNGSVIDELVVIPTHAFGEEDADYAVACAVPANAPGVKMIANFGGAAVTSKFDRPDAFGKSWTDPTIIFDDVFVPTDRVFMAGEWEYSRFVARTFGTFLRATEVGHAPEEIELYAGVAQLITEMNGLTGIRPIKEKINEIAVTSQLLALLRDAAVQKSEIVEGVALPDPLATNLLKLYYSEGLSRAMAILAEISGGGVVTTPMEADFENPETAALVRKYFQGAGGVDGESRTKVFKLIYDLVASESAGYRNILMLQGGGSPAVARAMAAATFNMPNALKRARQAAGIE